MVEDEEAMLAHMYSPQVPMKLNTITVATAGRTKGRITLKNSRTSPLPSTRAASISSEGMESKKFLNI